MSKSKKAPRKPKSKAKARGRTGSVPASPGYPIYESKKQAAQGIPCSIDALNTIQKAGCAGFRHNRVYTQEVLASILTRLLEDPDIDWSRRLKRVQTLREEFRLSEDQGRVIDRNEVRERAIHAVSLMVSRLERLFKSELPARLKGMDEAQIRSTCDQEICRLVDELKEQFEKLAERNGVPEAAAVETKNAE